MTKKPLYLEWVDKAKKDLKRAKIALKAKDAEDVCFHSHQTLEKYLKAMLVYHQIDVPKIHDLPKLGRLYSQKNSQILNFIDDLQVIDTYYLPSRYPLEVEETSLEIAKEILKNAKRIVDFIKTQPPKDKK